MNPNRPPYGPLMQYVPYAVNGVNSDSSESHDIPSGAGKYSIPINDSIIQRAYDEWYSRNYDKAKDILDQALENNNDPNIYSYVENLLSSMSKHKMNVQRFTNFIKTNTVMSKRAGLNAPNLEETIHRLSMAIDFISKTHL